MRILKYFIYLSSVVLSSYFLIAGKDLIIPLVLAIFIWYLIDILKRSYSSVSIRQRRLPSWLSLFLAVVSIGVIFSIIINLITSNVYDVIQRAPEYQSNLARLAQKGLGYFNINDTPDLKSWFMGLDFGGIISNFAVAITGFVSDAGIIMIYLLFILIEQRSFRNKLKALARNEERYHEIESILYKIDSDIHKYIGIKTVTSLSTAIISYSIMSIMNLDFAIFWALLFFLFNYIPTFGSIIATAFPVLISLIQFQELYPFIVIALGLIAVQVAIGNILEPRLMGDSLNLSPLIILLSLALWGWFWGIPGMILSVPITVSLMIIFSHFPQTRSIAILFSKDGKL